ncbi:hypothetical protein H4O18_11595 [Arenibacter sp. BSSL-BM3]|uniref:Roadblock/LAMTOR2 domain-containing protein n=1 Tax=Arenibacter arenosicollis TaxID=2762274 RepID=A0ABR7QN60_9FLAO|nr:hypothetical protein [Arenibacter arenosicollis]MBC8768637.1 hypothetical protein [Arenibacter arenosicollis]
MKSKVNISVRRFFAILDFQNLRMLKKAIEVIQANVDKPQMSILGKLDNSKISLDEIKTNFEQELKDYWNGVLKSKVPFGIFPNAELGTLFIAGNLASQFLLDISGIPLGSMSAGPYGILRGLGLSEYKVNFHLKLLKEGHFLLLVRDSSMKLELIEEELEKLS